MRAVRVPKTTVQEPEDKREDQVPCPIRFYHESCGRESVNFNQFNVLKAPFVTTFRKPLELLPCVVILTYKWKYKKVYTV